jgi:transcriptional regulator with XRE-family HTH domain
MAKKQKQVYKPSVVLSSKTIAANVRRLRESKNLSQEAVAADMDMSDSQYSLLENAKRKWTIELVQSAAEALGEEPTALLGTNNVITNSGNNSPGAFGGHYTSNVDSKQTDVVLSAVTQMNNLFEKQNEAFMEVIKLLKVK